MGEKLIWDRITKKFEETVEGRKKRGDFSEIVEV